TGELKIAKTRWMFCFMILLSCVASFAALMIISMGTAIYFYPLFVLMQFVGILINLYGFRNNYIQENNVRSRGCNNDGEFHGYGLETRIYRDVLGRTYKLKRKQPHLVGDQETGEINADAIGASGEKAVVVVKSPTIAHMSEHTVLANVA